MAYKIEQSTEAIRDFFGILDYLTETLFSPAAARRFDNELESLYTRLRDNPLIYPLCRDETLAAKGFHFASVMRYLVFFTVDETAEVVHIHRIFYGARNYIELI